MWLKMVLSKDLEGVMRILHVFVVAAGFTAASYGQGEWPGYAGDPAAQRYSRLKQISAANVSKLKLAWQYGVNAANIDLSAANRVLTSTEAVPLMAGGLLFTPTVHHSIVALEPETGKSRLRPNNETRQLAGLSLSRRVYERGCQFTEQTERRRMG